MTHDIRIGTLAGKNHHTPTYIASLLPLGFETFEVNFWRRIPDDLDLKKIGRETRRILEDSGAGADVTALGLYSNPLEDKDVVNDWKRMIDAAGAFGCDTVVGFAGCLTGKPVPEGVKAWKKTFGPLLKRARDRGLRVAFENCPMGSQWHSTHWNIAYCPQAWTLMFDAIDNPDDVGLAWEPCHQLSQLIDPIAQLREWAPKVLICHGKDASVYRDVIARHGIAGHVRWHHHRTPGFGDTNWTDVISILRQAKFKGAINIEGWHDPAYRDELEMTGQVHALHYLKRCRGGDLIENPPHTLD